MRNGGEGKKTVYFVGRVHFIGFRMRSALSLMRRLITAPTKVRARRIVERALILVGEPCFMLLYI